MPGTICARPPVELSFGAPLTEFLAMGGYAAYVWPAYGFAALVLIGLLAQSWRSSRRRVAELEQLRHLARPGRVRTARLRRPEEPEGRSFPRPATE
jgi:heme exporter protein D